MKILDNEQIQEANEAVQVLDETLATISNNYPPFGAIISSALILHSSEYITNVANSIAEIEPNLAGLLYDAADELDRIKESA